jgi:TetR/AcrR family transcriptional repressor of bet genes
MPRIVDHEERRRHIVQALLSIAATRGLDAVSLREVGQAAGVSMGTVQHYFASKDDMLVYALRHWLTLGVHQGFSARVQARLGSGTSPAAIADALAAEYLPYDEPSRRDVRIALAFSARAAVDARVAEALLPAFAGLVGTFRALIGDRAWEMVALLDGLRTPVLLGAIAYEDALTLVRQSLATPPTTSVRDSSR